jgi:hypothetical protein
MLTLLGSLIGFLSSALPKLFEFFDQRENNRLQIEVIKAQIEASKVNKNLEIKFYESQKEILEQELLLKHDVELKDNWLSSSVRPTITYLFFFLFAAVKISMIWHAIATGNDFYAAMQITWDEETQAIFAAIISFWFGNRAFKPGKKKRRSNTPA